MLAVWLVSLGLISLSCIEAKWLSHSALIAKAESVPAGEHNYYREHLDKITASLNEVRGGEKDPDILPDGYTGTRFYELRGWFECQCAGAVTIVHDEKEPFYLCKPPGYIQVTSDRAGAQNHLKHVDQREIMGTPPSNQRVTAYFAVQHRPGEANSAWQDCTLHYQTWTVMMFLNFDAIYITEENTVLYAKPDEGAYFSDKCDDAAMKSIGLPESKSQVLPLRVTIQLRSMAGQ
ncbi:hypothetical protein E5Q_02061 [Mixia osmundae IAM 14324]|uniref:Uncharacterized protein n=1 Tax=Mixia osmundae (strain CBS 9802 / IAM 14324 / JCM 22182 / KY 12970) TaxID=764103 RepID=G7DXU7_MIXOS|nr:hypothetical protein E5Q_02061 [Mixia osmundae IAM 14324]